MKTFNTLKNNDVVSAQISDHHPIVHGDTLFWNIMMKGKFRRGRFNNGFGLIESNADYQARLAKVADVIAEIVSHNPSIHSINLCEGPVEADDVKHFLTALSKHPELKRHLSESGFHQPNHPDAYNWGLMMFADSKFTVTEMSSDFVLQNPSLERLRNRFQLWALTDGDKTKYVALTHLPFGGDVHTTEETELSDTTAAYRKLVSKLLNEFGEQDLVITGDFNFSPYLMGRYQARLLDAIPHHNSTLFHNGKQETVTVDGILLSDASKRRRYRTPMYGAMFTQRDAQWLERHRHQHAQLQHAYDQRFGLVVQ